MMVILLYRQMTESKQQFVVVLKNKDLKFKLQVPFGERFSNVRKLIEEKFQIPFADQAFMVRVCIHTMLRFTPACSGNCPARTSW